MPTDGIGNAKVQRRLAAILAADIAGYSALMGSDEASTVRDLKAHQAVILPMVDDHGGRIIDTAGDGILAEFGSVVNAVECAVALQKAMVERNVSVEADRQMQFRIGINLGDVIHDDARVYGDGVNIAARLEGIAEPGGICVSGTAYEHVHKKLPLAFTDLGEQQLKNIASAVRIYRLELRNDQSISPPQEKKALSLPDKPSIAVLPFTNMSGDASQEYFSDGITEDIITELSRFSELFVIARNSSFQYKGKSPDIRQVGRELGVRYVLEGSIRRAGDRVRITGQLIDATTGAHRWAERYDRTLEDVFAVQDEVARTIVAILAAHVNKAEAERTLQRPSASWQAYDYYLQAAELYLSFLSSFAVDELNEVRKLLNQCLSIDPRNARAYALLSNTYVIAFQGPVSPDYLNSSARDRALQLALKAVQLDPTLPFAYAKLGNALTVNGQLEQGIAAFERAIALNPNFTDWRFMAPLVYTGQFERALEVAERHKRFDPFYPPLLQLFAGFAHYMLKEYLRAIPLMLDGASRVPRSRWCHTLLAATFAQLGRSEDAGMEALEVLRIDPNYSIQGTETLVRPFKFPEHAEHFFDGLRKAGLPDR